MDNETLENYWYEGYDAYMNSVNEEFSEDNPYVFEESDSEKFILWEEGYNAAMMGKPREFDFSEYEPVDNLD